MRPLFCPDTNATTYNLLAGRLAKRGYIVFVVRYFDRFADQPKELVFFQANVKNYLKIGDSPDYDRLDQAFQKCLTAVCDGVKYVRVQPGVDKERIGLVGFSLGAFLALSAATRKESKVTVVVDLFGGLPEDGRQHAQALPPVLILHGDKDQVVSVETAYRLQGLLKDKQIVHEIQVYKGVGHMFVNDKGQLRWDAVLDAEKHATAFLDKYLQCQDAKTTASR